MYTITFGGWYQRTTLHLSEIYNFFAFGESKIGLDKSKLEKMWLKLGKLEVTREIDYLEYVKVITENGIEIRYFEDGLYVLEKKVKDLDNGRNELELYFNENINPAISYLFSLGAPVPKILANMEIKHPTVVFINKKNIDIDEEKYGNVYGEIETDLLSVRKTHNYIFINSQSTENIKPLIEMQIFFREFKDQLERYLNIHREIWEDISKYKEKKSISGKEVEDMRNYLDSCQKTVNLIGSRINQMNSYLNTRLSISKKMNLEDKLLLIFQYKFETLLDTHTYIKEVWKMTVDYLNTAMQVVKEARVLVNNGTLQSLTWITTVGVVSAIITHLSKDNFPRITLIGIWYYILLIIVTNIINYVIQLIVRNKKYSLDFNENHKN